MKAFPAPDSRLKSSHTAANPCAGNKKAKLLQKKAKGDVDLSKIWHFPLAVRSQRFRNSETER